MRIDMQEAGYVAPVDENWEKSADDPRSGE